MSRNAFFIRRWLAREILGRDIPLKFRAKDRRGPARDPAYRAWIRTHPCSACGTIQSIECAHTGRDGGMAQKASDFSSIPLCSWCHTLGPYAYHRVGRAAFERRNRIDCAQLSKTLAAQWSRV